MDDLSKVWEISPYDASAYGALVFILMAAVIYLTKLTKSKDDKIHELTDKMHQALDIVTEKLVEVRATNMENKVAQEKMMFILEDLKHTLNGKVN